MGNLWRRFRMPDRLRSRLVAFGDRHPISPARFTLIARIALGTLILIVLTGAAVRLTGSGLGCPTWPKCTDTSVHTSLNTHGVIEFGNRMLTSVVSIAVIAAAIGAFLRRPYRRDLSNLALLLPLGVLGQIILGGMTVLYGLEPSWVMAHFCLSMLILVAAVFLVWRAREEPYVERFSSDRVTVWATRALIPLGAVTIFAGTAATAGGPHAGGEGTGDLVPRWDFKGADTLDWLIHQHGRVATVLGLVAIGVWCVSRRRGATREHLRPIAAVCLLLALQGLVGLVQYELELPAELVWVHVVLSSMTWSSIVWAVAAAGRLAPRAIPAAPQREETAAA
jgi:cytochrome c oxidase assembly protein subunit 15